jgi:hypothetical protein
MGATTYNHLTITPAEGFDSLSKKLIDSLGYESVKGFEVNFRAGVPIRYRGGKTKSYDEYIGGIWGGENVLETYDVAVTSTVLTATFMNQEDAPTNWVQNLSKKFPTAVFHLSFLNDYWNYGGEITVRAGQVINEITEDTATAARARATHLPDMTEDKLLGWEAQDAYVTMFPERAERGYPKDGWIEHILEIGAEQIIPEKAEELTRVLAEKLNDIKQWEAEREARLQNG